jgi:hypothetical protein
VLEYRQCSARSLGLSNLVGDSALALKTILVGLERGVAAGLHTRAAPVSNYASRRHPFHTRNYLPVMTLRSTVNPAVGLVAVRTVTDNLDGRRRTLCWFGRHGGPSGCAILVDRIGSGGRGNVVDHTELAALLGGPG